MNKPIRIIAGSVWGIALVLLGLWCWQRAEGIADLLDLRRVELAVWAVRAAALAQMAAGEALMALLVVQSAYPRRALGRVMGLSALVVCMVSALCAVSLGLAGR